MRKCVLCYDKVKSGELTQPACTAACPTKATIFGERAALLAEAHARIAAEPGRYIDRVWGEHEVGGTSVLYISDVDLSTAGWPAGLRNGSYPALTQAALSTVPWTFASVGAAAFGLSWIIDRRRRLAGAPQHHRENDTARSER